MFQPVANPVPIGAPAGKLTKGLMRDTSKSRFRFDCQELTFLLSICAQITGLVLSVVGLTQPDIPELLLIILWIELTVQGIELVWYSVVGSLYLCGLVSISARWRYVDWALSTPTMLISTLLLIFYFACPKYPWSSIVADESKVAAMYVAVIFNYMMLLIG